MKKVRFLDEPKEEKALNPIEFTHYLNLTCGWVKSTNTPKDFKEIVYLGKSSSDGTDLFCAKINKTVSIYKGHLNDGVY